MSKKQLILTIEEDVIKQAKKHIPNISGFVEECLEHHLGLANGTYPIAKDLDILDQISKLQVQLFILNENYDVEESRQRAEEFEKDKTVRFLWNEYRKNMIVDEQSMTEALTILPVDAETLEDMLDFAYVNQEELGLNFTWSKLYELYENEEVE